MSPAASDPTFALFDLVEYRGAPHVVCGTGPRVRLVAQKSWPTEFPEIGDFVRPEPFEAQSAEVKLLERGADRLLAVSRDIVEADEGWQANERTDWNDVDRILARAASTLPSALVEYDLDRGSWRLSETVPDSMIELVQPLSTFIATHAMGGGDADLSDIDAAVSQAREALEQADTAPKPSV